MTKREFAKRVWTKFRKEQCALEGVLELRGDGVYFTATTGKASWFDCWWADKEFRTLLREAYESGIERIEVAIMDGDKIAIQVDGEIYRFGWR